MRIYKIKPPFRFIHHLPCIILTRQEADIFARDGVDCVLRGAAVRLAKEKYGQRKLVGIYDHRGQIVTYLRETEVEAISGTEAAMATPGQHRTSLAIKKHIKAGHEISQLWTNGERGDNGISVVEFDAGATVAVVNNAFAEWLSDSFTDAVVAVKEAEGRP